MNDIMESEFVSGMWTKAKPIDKVINSKYFNRTSCLLMAAPCISPVKRVVRGMDIFMSVKLLEVNGATGESWT